jgi:hypothetical protein
MANPARGERLDISLSNEVIRNYSYSFERHSYTTLGALSLFVFFLSLFVFLEVWYGNYEPIVLLRVQIALAISLVFIIFVAFFWSLLAKPHFQIVVIERSDKDQPKLHTGLFERMFRLQGEPKKPWRIPLQASMLLLFPPFLSLGLALATIIAQFDTIPLFIYYDIAYYVDGLKVFANSSVLPHAPVGPVILVVALFVFLFIRYRANPQRMQRRLLWFLALPPCLLYVVLFSQISRNAPGWWRDIALGLAPSSSVVAEGMFISSRLALLVILTVILYLLFHYNAKLRDFYIYVVSRDSRNLIDYAEALLPKRVHVGDAQSIFFDLTRSEVCAEGEIDGAHQLNNHLEIEIQAAGLSVDGDKKVTACETSALSTSTWNCSFPTAGTQAINLLISVIQPSNDRDIVFAYKHDVRVDNFISESWKPLIAIVTPILPVLISAALK